MLPLHNFLLLNGWDSLIKQMLFRVKQSNIKIYTSTSYVNGSNLGLVYTIYSPSEGYYVDNRYKVTIPVYVNKELQDNSATEPFGLS